MLELTEIKKGYGNPGEPGYVPVLDSLSLKLSAGDSIAVLGPSGCGKSTLLNIIGTLDKPSGGQVTFTGKDLTALGEEKLSYIRNQEIGFVFQMHHLLPHLTVLENVLIPTLAYPQKDKSVTLEKRAKELLDKMGISECMNRRPGELSGGQRQRAAVARALINSPKLLLADEPTGSLDHETAVGVMSMLRVLNRTENITLIVVTHAADLAKQFKQVYTLREGKLSETENDII
ncbi:MAG: ABC transporter ATP-binding protein [Deltaproteobacteria bacterium]|nr:ABC transporter ATP-binding protein [Deltaproteobacteria bacterium]